jgi:Mg2+/citrate symporter
MLIYRGFFGLFGFSQKKHQKTRFSSKSSKTMQINKAFLGIFSGILATTKMSGNSLFPSP